jgi:hypothetical protein
LKKLVAVLITAIMVASAVLVLPSASFGAGKTATVLEMSMSGCTNTMTCNAKFLVGDEVTFEGVLTTADGEPVRDAEINIIKFIPKPAQVVVASGVTGIDGDFSLTWNAAFTEVEKAPQDVTRKILDENTVIYADFGGNDKYAPSRSAKNTAVISANAVNTFVNSDKNTYKQGEPAIVFMAFVDSNDNFVDLDSLRVVLNDQDVKTEKKKEGSYTLTIPTLPKEHTQIFVIPKKAGYNAENGFLTLIVDGLK